LPYFERLWTRAAASKKYRRHRKPQKIVVSPKNNLPNDEYKYDRIKEIEEEKRQDERTDVGFATWTKSCLRITLKNRKQYCLRQTGNGPDRTGCFFGKQVKWNGFIKYNKKLTIYDNFLTIFVTKN
jgi:hypothetical protein